MKIALIHYATPPVIGGVERIIGEHAHLFRHAGHEVVLVSQHGDATVRLGWGSLPEAYLAQLRAALTDCDVVMVHNVLTMPFDLALTDALERLPSMLPRARFFAWVHDVAASNPDLAPVDASLQRAWPGYHYVAVSELRARQFAEVTGRSCQMIPNGIDPARILGLPPSVADFAGRHGLFEGRVVLLHPTRLLRRKNVELGIAVMAAWRDAGHDATLVVTGAEDPHNLASLEYAASLRAARDRLGLAKEVRFAGDEMAIGDAELAGFYGLADALFLPSRQEGFGLPVLEAEARRIPAFVADIAPLDEIAGPNTRRFDLDTPPSELASWMREELMADSGARARRHALRWRWSRIYTEHLGPLLEDV